MDLSVHVRRYGIDFIGTFTDHDPVEEAQDVYHLLAEVHTYIQYSNSEKNGTVKLRYL